MKNAELLQIIEKATRDKVTELDLSNKKLNVLPAEIGNFVNLKKLDLSGNQLTVLHQKLAAWLISQN